jgi:predicted  nucleic acid-binding Zn-ribbon protein
VGAKGEASLTVTERNRSDTKVSVASLIDPCIEIYAQGGIPVDVIRKAVQPVRDKQVEQAAVNHQLQQLQEEVSQLTVDQNRVRENLQALKGSKEEKALAQRYVKDLAAQEDRLVTLRANIAAAVAQQEIIRVAIDQLLERVEFDLTGP